MQKTYDLIRQYIRDQFAQTNADSIQRSNAILESEIDALPADIHHALDNDFPAKRCRVHNANGWRFERKDYPHVELTPEEKRDLDIARMSREALESALKRAEAESMVVEKANKDLVRDLEKMRQERDQAIVTKDNMQRLFNTAFETISVHAKERRLDALTINNMSKVMERLTVPVQPLDLEAAKTAHGK